ncbi:hypothetical protein TNIN_411161 [Trichonephila inaurata madagascariensis]|uniref:Uncharacterized protein n=1 Tax=Trichonephila inaurata madagascariensis TaxID=2747483 RepID=A0A8X6K7W0_9ARAC|nr:hypothetical protein TNIN_411161 [Trichonephila inaurata madagascariensis]
MKLKNVHTLSQECYQFISGCTNISNSSLMDLNRVPQAKTNGGLRVRSPAGCSPAVLRLFIITHMARGQAKRCKNTSRKNVRSIQQIFTGNQLYSSGYQGKIPSRQQITLTREAAL